MSEELQGNYRTRTDICLRCPQGCEVQTMLGPDDEILNMSGNKCKLGIEYVKQEIQDPRRVLPTSIKVRNGKKPMVPVWTPEAMPKPLLLDLAKFTRTFEVDAPVHVGDVLVEDWQGKGIRLVASGEVEKADA